MENEEEKAPLWKFLYGSRPPADELAYRKHFLGNDIHQIKVMSYASMGFMLALTLKDIPELAEHPSLMSGIVMRFVLILFGVYLMWTIRSDHSPRLVDIKVIIFSCIVAMVLISVHVLPDITPTRMVGVGTLFIMAVHIGYPSYARILLPSVVIAIGGETAILLFAGRPNLEGSKVMIPLVFGFAEYIAVLGSAYYLRTRYQAFKAISQVKTLRGMLPICACCKKVRDDQGYYRQIETYISEHSEAEFSHDICPECTAELYPEVAESKSGEKPDEEAEKISD